MTYSTLARPPNNWPLGAWRTQFTAALDASASCAYTLTPFTGTEEGMASFRTCRLRRVLGWLEYSGGWFAW